jgi:hypothetical protein
LYYCFLVNLKKIKIKKNILLVVMVFSIGVVRAQVDKIYKHSGDVVEGKVVRLDEYTITFKYEGEDAENTIGKYAVEKIIYGKTKRQEDVTEKIVVNGEDDWEKVVILEDKAFIAGLKKVGEVRGKTGLINFQTGNTGDKKAQKKLKMDTAKQGCAFVLMTSDKTTVGANSNALGGTQAIKTGVAYKY